MDIYCPKCREPWEIDEATQIACSFAHERDVFADEDTATADRRFQAWQRARLPRCLECGNVNDDNPTQPICRTCSDWIVTVGKA